MAIQKWYRGRLARQQLRRAGRFLCDWLGYRQSRRLRPVQTVRAERLKVENVGFAVLCICRLVAACLEKRESRRLRASAVLQNWIWRCVLRKRLQKSSLDLPSYCNVAVSEDSDCNANLDTFARRKPVTDVTPIDVSITPAGAPADITTEKVNIDSEKAPDQVSKEEFSLEEEVLNGDISP